MRYGHRQTLEPSQVKSSTGLNRDAWPLKINHLREDRTGPCPAFVASATEPVSRLDLSASIRGISFTVHHAHGDGNSITEWEDVDVCGECAAKLTAEDLYRLVLSSEEAELEAKVRG